MIKVELEGLDLAALLCSRMCHDVISPVGAIVNGLEVLEDEKDESMRNFALDLIKKSSKQASARLQFARIAFGAAGSAGSSIDTGDAEHVARAFLQDDKNRLTWNAARVLMPKNKVKLLLNLLVLAVSAIPRGGQINVTVEGTAETPNFTIKSKGLNARIPTHSEHLLSGHTETGSVDAHGIQVFYTGLIAKAAKMDIKLVLEGDEVTITAKDAVEPAAEIAEARSA